MKRKLIHLITLCVALLSFSSCSQSLSFGNKASVSFNFRAMDPFYDGGEIRVSVYEDDKVITYKTSDMSFNTPSFTFNFTDLNVGSKLKIRAEITKDIDGVKTLIYSGTSDEFKVKSGDNKIPPIVLDSKIPKLTVIPSGTLVIDKNSILGSIFEVSVNNEVQKLNIGKNTPLAVDFFIKENTDCVIKACIKATDGKVLYDFTPLNYHVVQNAQVEVEPLKTKYVLWSNTLNDHGDNRYAKSSYKVFEGDIEPSWKIEEALEGEFEIQDFYINDNQTVWTLELDEVPDYHRNFRIFKQSSGTNEKTELKHSFDLNAIDAPLKIVSFCDNDKKKDVALVVTTEYDTSGNYVFYYVYEGDESLNGSVKLPILTFDGNSITAATVDKNDLYISEKYTIGESETENYFRIIKMGNIYSILNKHMEDIHPEVIFDSKNTININSRNLILNECRTSDMRMIDGILYALVIYDDTISSSPKGGLLTIDTNKQNKVTPYYFMTKGPYPDNKYATLDREYPEESDLASCLIGPRRFVAIKPKKLIIADDGAYGSDRNSLKGKNRIVTVDIENNMKTTITDLDNITFTGYITGTTSSGFDYSFE